MTAHREERRDKKDSESNFLEMETTKKSENLGNVQEDREKQHLQSFPGKECESLFDIFLLIHFDITSLQQAPSLLLLFASDMPPLSQYWSSSQTGLARYPSELCSHLFELLKHTNKKSC